MRKGVPSFKDAKMGRMIDKAFPPKNDFANELWQSDISE
jgi:hypothetical protein